MSYRRRKPYRKRKTFKKGYHPYVKATAPAVGYVAYKVAQKVVKKYVNVEYKYYDANSSSVSFATASVTNLNPVPQGDGVTARDGNQIKTVSIQFRGLIRAHADATRCQTARVIIVNCNRQDDTDPDVSSAEYGIVDNAVGQTLRNLGGSARNRYRILMDRTYCIPALTESGGIKLCEYYKKITLKNVFGSSGTDAPRKNSLWLLLIGDNLQASAEPIIDYSSRIRFLDN